MPASRAHIRERFQATKFDLVPKRRRLFVNFPYVGASSRYVAARQLSAAHFELCPRRTSNIAAHRRMTVSTGFVSMSHDVSSPTG